MGQEIGSGDKCLAITLSGKNIQGIRIGEGRILGETTREKKK